MAGEDISAPIRDYTERIKSEFEQDSPDLDAINNLLLLAEERLKDSPLPEKDPTSAELGKLRNRWEKLSREAITTTTRANLIALFETTERILGSERAEEDLLPAVRELLADPQLTKLLDKNELESYSKRLKAIEVVHQRKRAGSESAVSTTGGVKRKNGKEPTQEKSTLSSGSETNSSRYDSSSNKQAPTQNNPSTSTWWPPFQFTLIGEGVTFPILLGRLWRLMIMTIACMVGLVKARAPAMERFAWLRKVRGWIERVPMPFWGATLAGIALYWMLDGWIVYGLANSLAMLSLAIYVAIDAIERTGVIKPEVVARVRRRGVWFPPIALLIAIVHVAIGGAWIVI